MPPSHCLVTRVNFFSIIFLKANPGPFASTNVPTRATGDRPAHVTQGISPRPHLRVNQNQNHIFQEFTIYRYTSDASVKNV